MSATEFNEDELHPPDWLNENFILEVLRDCEKQDDIELLALKISPATGKNDHYASIMFRAFVKYGVRSQVKERSLILKTMPEVEGHKKDFLKGLDIFETEIGMYTQIIPKFEEILRAAGDDTKFGPSCLYHSLSPRKVIIFEDMVPHGYTVLRERLANNEETKAIYSKIAKWHAISYKLHLEQPELFRNYATTPLTQILSDGDPFCSDGITNFIEMLDEHEDLRSYKQYFEPLEGKLLDYVIASFEEHSQSPQPDAYYVLCHGDFHHKNMLFKYEEEGSSKLRDVLLIDYQMCYVGPIVNDIINSTFMILDSKERLRNLDELFYFYFSEFQETLRKIGFKGAMPNMIEFKRQMTRHRHFELFLFTTFLPLLLAIHAEENDIGVLITSVESRKSVFKNKVYIDEVRRLLPIYLHIGYLEN